jgi:hypothetical protein
MACSRVKFTFTFMYMVITITNFISGGGFIYMFSYHKLLYSYHKLLYSYHKLLFSYHKLLRCTQLQFSAVFVSKHPQHGVECAVTAAE